MIDVACVLVFGPGEAVLGVTRGRSLLFGLPGGHVEPGEGLAEAARRELYEETGLRALGPLRPVYAQRVGHHRVVTFLATAVAGRMRPSEEGYPMWVEPSVLLNGAYPEYMRNLFSVV